MRSKDRGNGDDLGHVLAVDSEGNVHITGHTESAGYPVTLAADRSRRQGVVDATIAPS
ncbi:MAG: SBBP repeat-containing protein [Gemmatimonadota bacterium]|nr:MAG: SBBP repeat-containing protein [Gemmatimonadota bacterium]